MSKERQNTIFTEKEKAWAKKVFKWAIIVGGAVVGIKWFLNTTKGI